PTVSASRVACPCGPTTTTVPSRLAASTTSDHSASQAGLTTPKIAMTATIKKIEIDLMEQLPPMFIVERIPRKTSRTMLCDAKFISAHQSERQDKMLGEYEPSQLAEDLFDQCFHLLPY